MRARARVRGEGESGEGKGEVVWFFSVAVCGSEREALRAWGVWVAEVWGAALVCGCVWVVVALWMREAVAG